MSFRLKSGTTAPTAGGDIFASAEVGSPSAAVIRSYEYIQHETILLEMASVARPATAPKLGRIARTAAIIPEATRPFAAVSPFAQLDKLAAGRERTPIPGTGKAIAPIRVAGLDRKF